MKAWLRSLLRPLPQWSSVAIAPGPPMVVAYLHHEGGSDDVTTDHTVAALKPLTLATSVDGGLHPQLEYRDRATGKRLGALRLARVQILAAGVVLYRVVSGEHHCLGWARRPWSRWLQNRAMRRNRSPQQNLLMEPEAVQQLMIAYLYPRPVVLVSVDAPGHGNIFPMDLIGPLERAGLFSLALRSTNVSQPVMREVGKVALSAMPATMKSLVYGFSAHHKQPPDDWNSLAIPMRRTPTLGIPTVADALRVQELTIVHSQEIGSHVFFLCRVVADDVLARGDQLHHTAGFHQAYRRRLGAPFTQL